MNNVVLVAAALLGLRLAAQWFFEWLNARHVRAHADEVPEAFRETVDPETYRKSVAYTLERSRFSRIEDGFNAVLIGVILFSGVLPKAFYAFADAAGRSPPAMAAFLFLVGMVLAIAHIPFEWYSQFHIEQRFGFNTTSRRLWWIDRIKAFLLSVVLGVPLLVLILKLVEWTGNAWWLWAWAAMMAFQMLIVLLAPVLILPLFNKFTPLPEGSLRERLLALTERTGFRARAVQVMDGSKRSRHSNAFFTGLGRFRKIVLFDTLVQQLSELELEAVLAHEIGHYKKRHIPKLLAWAAVSSLVGFFVLAWLARQEWFYRAFGFEPGSIVPALLLFTLLSGAVTFWLSPIASLWSRRYEYQADRFAADAMSEAESLIGALRKLNEKNLANLTPHPVYSGFYYSHPTLLEREEALRVAASAPRAAHP